ncbi:gluconokinase [Georgenia thermotolerans]|uniref:Sugar kinase n=1 Tax=Georgenia thermotolerans TaxID=527326 RepID=A0A7J5ULN1_9MICO|nr:gluconokinase [Georgenia thermotolerans]KAE8763277.1 sugar kinase [Georgenia thermotolerans]
MPKTVTVELDHALEPFVLALDVGSTASRGGLYDAAGRPVRGLRHKVPHQFRTAADGTSEIDPDAVVAEIAEILTEVTDHLPGRRRVAGVALDTFASSLVGVDADGAALTPCYTYADSRCAPQLRQLRGELDEAAVQQRTGTRLHTSYLPPRLRWLRETAPDTVARTARWLSLGEYVHLRLLGATAVGTSTAAWTGMLDRRTGAWDAEMLAAAGIDAGNLSEIRDPDRPLRDDGRTGRRWPALAGAAWFPVITDGFASNIGAGAADESAIAAAAATSGAMRVVLHEHPETIPPGLWCYRVDAARTLLGGALNDVGRVVTWLEDTLRLDGDGLPVDREAALLAAPDEGAPVVLPYLTGERSTGWAGGARALFADVTAATTPTLLYRGALEGVALTYARVAEQLQQAAGRAHRIAASGRVTADHPGWLQVLADALDAPVEHVTMKRTTLHGTALIALEVLAPDVPRAPVETGRTYEPVAGRAEYYAARRARYQQLYEAVVAPTG